MLSVIKERLSIAKGMHTHCFRDRLYMVKERLSAYRGAISVFKGRLSIAKGMHTHCFTERIYMNKDRLSSYR